MKNIIMLFVFLFSICKLEAQDDMSNTNDCAHNLARNYFFKMGIADSIKAERMPLILTEVLNGKEIETQLNGVFIASNLNSHRRKLILLKKGNQLKLLTFNDVNKSLQELMLFLDDINSNEKNLFKYINFIEKYLESSKEKIKVVNKIDNTEWIDCK